MVVDLQTVEIAFEKILQHMKECGIRSVVIDSDFYWFIPPDERYDKYDKPKIFTIGQLTSDWDDLKKIATGSRQPVGLALKWLGEVLIPVGERSSV